MRQKKIIIVLAICTFATTCFSQFKPNEMVFSGQAGYKLLSELVITEIKTTFTSRYRNNPVWQGTFDYGISDQISLGFNFSMHNANLIHSYGGNPNAILVRYSRVDTGIRLLFHYGNKNDFDLYSGVRLGYKVDNIYPESFSALHIPYSDLSLNRPTLGLVLFGVRYWLNNSIAITTEINIGRPYIANIGIATRAF